MSALQEHTAPGKEQDLPQRRNNANVNREEGRKKENEVNVARMNVSVGGGRDGENYNNIII